MTHLFPVMAITQRERIIRRSTNTIIFLQNVKEKKHAYKGIKKATVRLTQKVLSKGERIDSIPYQEGSVRYGQTFTAGKK